MTGGTSGRLPSLFPCTEPFLITVCSEGKHMDRVKVKVQRAAAQTEDGAKKYRAVGGLGNKRIRQQRTG